MKIQITSLLAATAGLAFASLAMAGGHSGGGITGDAAAGEKKIAACTDCHADAETLDINGFQTETEEKLETLLGYLVANGLMAVEEGEPHPVPQPGVFPAEQTQAAWNYILLSYEDHSHGVHNPAYTTALLDWSISVFEGQ